MTSPTPPASPASSPESFVLTLPDDPASGSDWYLWAGLLALLVFVAFFPAVNGALVWDDDQHVGAITPEIETLAGLARIWSPFADPDTHQYATPQYYPLTFSVFWLEHHLWRDNTLGYHLVNLLLHAGSTVLIWRLLKRLKLPGAWLAAAIWAIHPLQAESVCWISELKNVLSGLLFFASIWFYLDFTRSSPFSPSPGTPGEGRGEGSATNPYLPYTLSLLLLTLGLLAKSVVCVMPVAILILLWWQGRKIFTRRTLLPLIPFFAVGLIMSQITVYRETAVGGSVEARGPDWNLSILQRFLIAGRGIWFYVGKLLLPANLTFSYPRLVPDVASLQWLYLLAAVVVLVLLWIKIKSWGRGPFAAAVFYVATLFPSLGFINIYPMRYSFVADHFQYLSGLSLIVLAVALASRALARFKLPPAALAGIATALVIALTLQTRSQASTYDTPIALYRDILSKNPDSWMAADNLGIELIKSGQFAQRQAAADKAQGDTDLSAADTQDANDDFKEAESRLRRALELRPSSYVAHNSLGLLYRLLDRLPEAEAELKAAVELDHQDDQFHQLMAPYINYIQFLEEVHPDADVKPYFAMAFDLANQPRARTTDKASAHIAYGDYWFRQAANDHKSGHGDAEESDLNQAIAELGIGLQTKPTDRTALLDIGHAWQRMSQLDQSKADASLAAGFIDRAADYVTKSHQVDDQEALRAYTALATIDPIHPPAAVLESMGEVYYHSPLQRENQADAVNDLLQSLQFFKDALASDPKVPNAPNYLTAINQQLTLEGAKAAGHESTWAPLRDALDAISKSDPTSPALKGLAAAADKPSLDALWPLPASHPLRQPLADFRLALRKFSSPQAPADAGKTLRDDAALVLKVWSIRNPARDALSDAKSAVLCYEGALEADEHSAASWRAIKAATDVLEADVTAQNDTEAGAAALTVARTVLDQHRSATMPSTMPAAGTGPGTRPAGL
jgi:tetratricopeptide (TPR) repeat protein